MTVAFSRHFENMKYLEYLYWYYKEDSGINEFIYPTNSMNYVEVTDSIQQNNLYNILNYPIIDEVNIF